MRPILDWDGEPITENGSYRGIDLSIYHGDTNLLPGPSVSKSSIKDLAPPDGSPKKFWSYWSHNPKRLQKPASPYLTYGKAVHALLLGDEVFEDKFVIRPDKVEGETYQGAKKVWINWFKEQEEAGFEVITKAQYEFIKLMAEDAAKHPFVAVGGLQGEVEVSHFARDPETGIWLRARPDVEAVDGDYSDLKTASSLNEGFLSAQFEGSGYYIQGALTRMVCRLLGRPFQSFSFVYVQSENYPDTHFRVMTDEDLDRGERVIRYCLKKIREGLSSGVWEGAAAYNRDATTLSMPKRKAEAIDTILAKEGF